MKNIRDKIEDIFRSYPDVGVNRNKFLIDELEQLFFQQKQEMVEEIEKELIWAGDELATEGDYGDFNKVLLNLKQKLNK